MLAERVVKESEHYKESSLVGTGDSSLGIPILRGRWQLAWNAGAVMVVKGVLAGAEGFQVSCSLSYNSFWWRRSRWRSRDSTKRVCRGRKSMVVNRVRSSIVRRLASLQSSAILGPKLCNSPGL